MPQMQIVAQLEHSLHKERERLQVKSFFFKLFFIPFSVKKESVQGPVHFKCFLIENTFVKL